MPADRGAFRRLEHLLEGEKVGFDGDGEMRGSAEEVEGTLEGHVFEALAVDQQDLVASLQTGFVRFRSSIHVVDENTVTAIPTACRCCWFYRYC